MNAFQINNLSLYFAGIAVILCSDYRYALLNFVIIAVMLCRNCRYALQKTPLCFVEIV